MEWISVKLRTPERNEFVAFTWDGHEISSEYSMDRTTKKWEREDPMGYIIEAKIPITHWVLRPAPPEEM